MSEAPNPRFPHAPHGKRKGDEDVAALANGCLQNYKMASGKFACPFPNCIYNKENMILRQSEGEPSHKLYFGTKVHLMEHLEQQHKNMYRAWSYMLN